MTPRTRVRCTSTQTPSPAAMPESRRRAGARQLASWTCCRPVRRSARWSITPAGGPHHPAAPKSGDQAGPGLALSHDGGSLRGRRTAGASAEPPLGLGRRAHLRVQMPDWFVPLGLCFQSRASFSFNFSGKFRTTGFQFYVPRLFFFSRGNLLGISTCTTDG